GHRRDRGRFGCGRDRALSPHHRDQHRRPAPSGRLRGRSPQGLPRQHGGCPARGARRRPSGRPLRLYQHRFRVLGRQAAGGGRPMRVVSDQWIKPTYAADAARTIVRLALSDAGGVAHVTSSDGCTWHGLAVEAIRLVGLAAAVEAVPASTYYSTARRPRNSALHTGRLTSLLGRSLPSWRDALRMYLQEKGHLACVLPSLSSAP